MYKNTRQIDFEMTLIEGFNPCFNGTMYKNNQIINNLSPNDDCFNPCFNGTMYKNSHNRLET